jgi:RNA polymerase sigma factor (sigma-70 family)
MSYDKDRVELLLKAPKVPEVVEELIQLNYGLVVKQLRKYGLLKDDDAKNLGRYALYKAITTYDSSNVSSFSNYATICIYNRLGSYVRSIKTPINTNTVSYDALMSDEGASYGQLLESPNTVESRLMSSIAVKEIYYKVHKCIAELKNPLHVKITTMWLDSCFTITHSDIALAVGCSQSYVTRVINAFRNNLKNKLEV